MRLFIYFPNIKWYYSPFIKSAMYSSYTDSNHLILFRKQQLLLEKIFQNEDFEFHPAFFFDFHPFDETWKIIEEKSLIFRLSSRKFYRGEWKSKRFTVLQIVKISELWIFTEIAPETVLMLLKSLLCPKSSHLIPRGNLEIYRLFAKDP